MPRAKQRTPALRAEVLRVAIATLEAEGTSALTARRIAHDAGTSMPAIYELFGDKAGLLREVFFEGFRMLRRRFDALPEEAEPREAVVQVVWAIRAFGRAHPALTSVMFSQPFTDFDPSSQEKDAGKATREFIVGRVRRCVDAEVFVGDATDLSHVLLAMVQGLALQEKARWLGRSAASIERRWQLAVDALLDGFARRAR